MGPGRLLPFGVCALALLSSAVAVLNCNEDDLFALGILEDLIGTAVITGDSPTKPTVVVQRNYTVCFSVGTQIGSINSVSLLISYSCVGNSNCPGPGSSGSGTEQFDFGCQNGQWITGQFSNFQAARDENPSATFNTTQRRDCAACFTQHPSQISDSDLAFDPATHCVDCSSECIAVTPVQPAMCYRRFGDLNQSCCNVYLNGSCQPFCPPPGDKVYAINSRRECIISCPQITVSNANVLYTSQPAQGNLYFNGTSASITCRSNYMGGGQVICNEGGWGTLPNCTLINCGIPPSLKNGNRTWTRTVVGSKATYQCNSDYVFIKDSAEERTCQVSGSWSSETIECETCSIPNCRVTTIVNGVCLCQKCEESFNDAADRKNCDSTFRDKKKDKLCLLCIILPIVAVILAILIAIAIAVAIYVYRKWKEAPSTKLKEKEANGLNGVARDNPLYLDPSTVEEEVG